MRTTTAVMSTRLRRVATRSVSMQVQWSSTVPESVAFTAASKAKYADQVADESRQRTEGRDAGHLYDHHV